MNVVCVWLPAICVNSITVRICGFDTIMGGGRRRFLLWGLESEINLLGIVWSLNFEAEAIQFAFCMQLLIVIENMELDNLMKRISYYIYFMYEH